ncbi:hypothetical protein AB0D49_08375 [Streptomyces sp. NPDC048290]|uniref:hypothetical protein n=1 Tax=Streptomyces sp. NPDC048290 TaxID=3155811 RepID=UPI0034303F5B
MTTPYRITLTGLAVTAALLAYATVQRDDASWIPAALWACWPLWAATAAGTVWATRTRRAG